LLLEIVGGDFGPVQETLDENNLPKPAQITLQPKRITSLLGFKVSDQRIHEILTALGMDVVKTGDDYKVTPPSYRFDIVIEEDLIEELVRMIGFADIKETAPKISMQQQHDVIAPGQIALARNTLKNRGYHEVITYSFVDRKTHDSLTGVSDPIVLDNPISSELSVMRASLWPGLINTYKYNVNRQQSRVRIFEHGLCFSRGEQIEQTMKFACLISGDALPEQWGEKSRALDFYDIKSDVQALLAQHFDVQDITFSAVNNLALHPGQSAKILHGDVELGCLGRIHPGFVKELGVSENVYLCELNFDLIRRATRKTSYSEFSKFPENRRDIALVIKEDISAGSLISHIQGLSLASLKNAYVFDTYNGEGITKGFKSYTIALIIQDLDKTLLDEDVAKIVKTVLNSLEDKFEAILRD
jgi:phenylalanyl-tRNA synthetase beta chain